MKLKNQIYKAASGEWILVTAWQVVTFLSFADLLQWINA